MNLNEKIDKSIELRNNIRKLELELLDLTQEISKEVLDELEFDEDIKTGDTIIETRTNKRFIIEGLTVYFDSKTLKPYVSPILRRVNADYTPGNVKGVDNYVHGGINQAFFDNDREDFKKYGQDVHKTSSIKINSANNMKNFFKVREIKKDKKFPTSRGYQHVSGYSSTVVEDDTIEYIISHTVSPCNLRWPDNDFKHEYFLEIHTTDGTNYLYTTPDNADKAVRITQKKIGDIKELILNNDKEKILHMGKQFRNSLYSSNWHSAIFNYKDEDTIKLFEYMSRIYNRPTF